VATYPLPDLEPRLEIAHMERKRLAFHLRRMASEAPAGIPEAGWAKIMRGELESIPLDWVRVIEYEFPILTTILEKRRDLFKHSDKLESGE